MLKSNPKANKEIQITKKISNQNQEHNVKKEALGPNIKHN